MGDRKKKVLRSILVVLTVLVLTGAGDSYTFKAFGGEFQYNADLLEMASFTSSLPNAKPLSAWNSRRTVISA